MDVLYYSIVLGYLVQFYPPEAGILTHLASGQHGQSCAYCMQLIAFMSECIEILSKLDFLQWRDARDAARCPPQSGANAWIGP
jgi:hypothetical protein